VQLSQMYFMYFQFVFQNSLTSAVTHHLSLASLISKDDDKFYRD